MNLSPVRFVSLLFVLAIVSLGPKEAIAQGKLYVLLAADTKDLVEPEALQGPLFEADFYQFQSVIKKLANFQDTRIDIKTVSGDSFTAREFDRQLNSVLRACGENDAVFVHFSGHGSYSNGSFHFHFNGGKTNRSTIVARLKNSNAKLKVITSDSCATIRRAENLRQVQLTRGAKIIEGNSAVTPLFRRLFQEASGIVDIVSAKKGQGAYGNSDHTQGGIFTSQLVGFLSSNATRDDVTWDQLFVSVSKSTNDAFKAQFPGGEWLPDGTSQRTQVPDKLELRVRYADPEPVVVEVEGPIGINARDGSIYRTKQLIRNGVVIQTTQKPLGGIANKIPASDGSWMWSHLGVTVYAQDQTPARGFFESERLGTSFFQAGYGRPYVVKSSEGAPGSNLRTSNGNRWLLEYGEEIEKINDVDVRTNESISKRNSFFS